MARDDQSGSYFDRGGHDVVFFSKIAFHFSFFNWSGLLPSYSRKYYLDLNDREVKRYRRIKFIDLFSIMLLELLKAIYFTLDPIGQPWMI